MLRENGTTRLNVVSRSSPTDDPFLSAVKEAAAADFTVLGEIGRGEGGLIMYLARETATRRLVALRLQREGQLADEFSLEVVRHLDNSMPAPASKCVKCGKEIKGWARFCSYCGADLTGAAPKEGDAVERALMLEAVKEAVSADYDVLGEMSRTEGGGAVYFACERKTSKIVALRLQREGAGDEFSVGLTTALKPIARSLGVKSPATQALSAMTRPPEPERAPPPPPPVTTAPPSPPPTRPAAPPPLPPAPAGMSTRTKLLVGGVLAVIAATALIIVGLPKSAPPPVAPVPADTVVTPPPAAVRADSAPGPVATKPSSPAPAVAAKPERRVAPPPPKDATVRIAGLPATAEVRVDSRIRVGRSLTVPAGRHALSVSVPGYLPRTDTMVLRAGETITWSPALTPEPPKQPVVAAPRPAVPAGPTCAASVQGEQWAVAFEACMRESLAGSAAAKRNLAQLYERGRGVERSDANAVRWYESAANGGDGEAMYQLATRYERGRGVKKDATLALQWYTKAGDAGLLSAQLALGEIYEKGRLGVTKDKAKALDWYRKAAAQGSKDAADKVRDLSRSSEMTTHTVLPGECLASIAERYGFTNPRVIYEHPANEALRRARPDPNVLLAGDEVVIPDRKLRVVTGATKQRYHFVVDRQPTYLRLRLLNPDDTPRSGLPYRLEYQGQVYPGTTGADGSIVQEVPSWLPGALLTVTDGGREEQYRVALGYLDPVTDSGGLKQRLKNLGYYVEVPGVPEDVCLRHAVHAYQHANDLPPTGYPDTRLYGKLVKEYCS